jgi:RNA polymerase sigma factor (TIGR02999 family)
MPSLLMDCVKASENRTSVAVFFLDFQMTTQRTEDPGDVTRLLKEARAGDREAFDYLMPLIYNELRRIAHRQLGREYHPITLNATGLVHEAYLKLVGQIEVDWQSRAHFLGVAARAMRQILIDQARKRNAEKRGGEWHRTTIAGKQLGFSVELEDLLGLDDALDRLGRLDERLRTVVEYRFFGGMTEKEIAEVLGVSERSVNRDWVKARAWLYKELYPENK